MAIGWFFLAGVSLLGALFRREAILPLPSTLALPPDEIVLRWDAPSRLMASFLIGVVALARAANLLGARAALERRAEMPVLLVLYGANVAALGAGNLLTLCLAWGATEATLACAHALRTPLEERRRTLWGVWGGFVTLLLVSAAAVLLLVGQGHTHWEGAFASPLVWGILFVSAVLKMILPLLSGRPMEHLETFASSWAIGALLGGRLLTTVPATIQLGIAVPLTAALLVSTAFLAAFAPNLSAAVSHIALNRLIMALFASFWAGAGPTLLWVVALDLLSTLALLWTGEMLLSSGLRWARWSKIWALLALLGMPLTPGFVVHWAFFQSVYLNALRPLFLWGALALLLTAIPLWRGITVPFPAAQSLPQRTLSARWAAIGALIVGASANLSLGVAPNRFVTLWGNVPLADLWRGSPDLLGMLTYVVLLGPFLGGYGLSRALEELPPLWKRVLEIVRGILVLDWLVYTIEEVLIRLQALVDEIVAAIERRFYLAWTLIWGIAVILLYVERRR